MKKTLLALITLFIGIISYSQCDIDPNCTSQICPGVVIPEGYVDEDYSVYFTLNIPEDTTINVLGNLISGDINYAVINSISGLPTSGNIAYECQTNECKTNGGESGCFAVAGTPTAGDAGLYTITIAFTINYTMIDPVTQLPRDVNLPLSYQYELIINDVASSLSSNEEVFNAYPNPAYDVLSLTATTNSEYELININGSTIMSGNFDSKEEINVSELPNGYYFIKIKNATDEVIKKVVIQ